MMRKLIPVLVCCAYLLEAQNCKVGMDPLLGRLGCVTGSGLPVSIATKTTSFSFAAGDTVILCDATAGTVTGTLPLATTATGKLYYFKKIDASANACTVATSGGQTIDGSATTSTTTQYTSKTVASSGANWFIL